MFNITRLQGTINIKDLEARQEALREELRQVQEQLEQARKAKDKRAALIAGIKEHLQWLNQFAAWDRQNFQNEILDCFDELLATPLGAWSAANGDESSLNNAVDGHQSNAGTNAKDEQAQMADKVAERKLVEKNDSEESDEAFEEYIDNLTEPEIDLDKFNSEVVGEETAKHLLAAPYAEFVALTPKVGYLRRTADGAILGAYLGGKNKTLLEVWARAICTEVTQSGGKCSYEVRSAERLRDIKYEVKFSGISFSVLQSLTELDTSKSPKFRATKKGIEDLEKGINRSDTLPAGAEPHLAEPTPSPLILQVGDRVLIESDRHGQEYVNKVGVVSAATNVGAAVNVGGTLKYFHADEVNMVERSPEVRNPANDLAVSASASLDLTDDPVPW